MTIETAFQGRAAVVPELRTSAAGKPWARFGVAVGEGDAVQWVSVSCFGAVAECAAERLAKGDRCYVEGTLRLDEWTDSQGVRRAGLKVAAWKVEPIGQIGQRKPKRSKASATPARPADLDPLAHLDMLTEIPGLDAYPGAGLDLEFKQ